MPIEVAEPKTTQKVESDAELDESKAKISTEKEEVSEESEKEKEGKPKEPITFSPEQEGEIEKRFQSQRDKELNPYREKRESDTALIRSLTTQLKEIKSDKALKAGNKLIETILGGDEEAGLTPDETKTREQSLKEFNQLYKDYKEKSGEVEQAAQIIADMAKEMPANVVKEFGLDDPNPSVRASNGTKFLNETAVVYRYSQNFLMAVEEFLPQGNEVRKQIEEIVEGLGDFSDEKSRKLYLKDKLQGFKVTTRKKPTAPSEVSGGKGMPESAKGKIKDGWAERHK